MNVQLTIAFEDRGKMEVDFLSKGQKRVLEIDGDQHLANEEVYRRDRRKDARLQEHGYFILRFLASDIGKRLDVVLDAILRAIKHCKRGKPD